MEIKANPLNVLAIKNIARQHSDVNSIILKFMQRFMIKDFGQQHQEHFI